MQGTLWHGKKEETLLKAICSQFLNLKNAFFSYGTFSLQECWSSG